MKTCRTCKLDKDPSEFRKHAKMSDGLSTQCRDCAKGISKERWKNSPGWRAKILANNVARQAENREYVRRYLLTHSCVDCGEPDLVVLDFDHVRGKKKYNVARLINMAVSMQTLIDEIAKCEVRCANCHRRKTAERHGGWWKAQVLVS